MDTTSSGSTRIAVLIDCDNVSAKHAAAVLEELAALPVPELAATGFDPAHLKTLQAELTPVVGLPQEEAADGYEVILKVPMERMAAVQPDLDALLQKHDLEVHVRHR